MPTISASQGCCGVRELYNLAGLSTLKIEAVYTAIHTNNKNGSFYWFADGVNSTNGDRLARYILKHNLGDLTEFGPTHNPQSGHDLKMWVWQIDVPVIDAWYHKRHP